MTRPIVREIKWRWQQLMDERDRVWLNGHQSCYFNRLMDLGDPVEDKDAATKKYVDVAVATGGSGIVGVPGNIPIIAPSGAGLVDGGFDSAAFDPAGEAAAEVGAHELAFDHTLLHDSSIIDGDTVDVSGKADGEVLTWVALDGKWEPAPGGGGGEANTASNGGTGIGLYWQKVGVDLQFKNIRGETGTGITAVDDAVNHDVVITPRYKVVGPITLHHDDASPLSLVVPTPARSRIVTVSWFPTEDFDGAPSIIDIGEDGDHSAFMADAIVTKTIGAGPVVTADIGVAYEGAINIRVWITPGAGCTTGEGKIFVEYVDMSG